MNINKAIMKEDKLTYEYIANALDYSKPFIWQIINNKRRLSYKNALLIAYIFNMKPDELFYDSYIDNSDIMTKISQINKNIYSSSKKAKRP